MSQADIVWFKSKVDRWLGGILVTVPLLEVGLLLSAMLRRDSEAASASLVGCGIVAGVYFLLVLPVHYGISTDSLLVRFGVVRQRIRFDAIREVYPTRSPLSSPALSLDRLAIRTGRGPLNLTLISPCDRDEFLQLLVARANLVRTGAGWERSEAPAIG